MSAARAAGFLGPPADRRSPRGAGGRPAVADRGTVSRSRPSAWIPHEAGRQRRERLQLQDVARHHHAHQLRRDELDADQAAARRIVNAGAHFHRDHVLDEGAKQVDLRTGEDGTQRRDESRAQVGIP